MPNAMQQKSATQVKSHRITVAGYTKNKTDKNLLLLYSFKTGDFNF